MVRYYFLVIIEFADKYMCICNKCENSKSPMHAASQYVTMVARLRGFVVWHSTWQIRSRHCKGNGLSSLNIHQWPYPCDSTYSVEMPTSCVFYISIGYTSLPARAFAPPPPSPPPPPPPSPPPPPTHTQTTMHDTIVLIHCVRFARILYNYTGMYTSIHQLIRH